MLIFHDTFEAHKDLIQEDKLIFIKGRPTSRLTDDTLKLIAESILSLDQVQDRYAKTVNIVVEVDKMKEEDVDSLFRLTKDHAGDSPLFFHVYDEKGNGKKMLAREVRVSADDLLLGKLKGIYGDQNVWVD